MLWKRAFRNQLKGEDHMGDARERFSFGAWNCFLRFISDWSEAAILQWLSWWGEQTAQLCNVLHCTLPAVADIPRGCESVHVGYLVAKRWTADQEVPCSIPIGNREFFSLQGTLSPDPEIEEKG